MARQNGSSVSTPQGAKCVAEKLNRGLLVRHVEQTLLSCVHIYFLRWLVNEFRLYTCLRVFALCDKTLSRANWRHSVLVVGCSFGRTAIPLCHCVHWGVQPVDGSHMRALRQTHMQREERKKQKQNKQTQTHVRKDKITLQLCAPANTQEHGQTNHAYKHKKKQGSSVVMHRIHEVLLQDEW